MATLILAVPAAIIFSALWLLEQFDLLPDREPLVRSVRLAALSVIVAATVLSPTTLANGVQLWIDHRLDEVRDPFTDPPPTNAP